MNHFRHWHGVYILRKHIHKVKDWCGPWRRNDAELLREGELFAYMHEQMLARYNAERKSWGLDFVKVSFFN